MRFTTNNTETINMLAHEACGSFKKETRYCVSFNLVAEGKHGEDLPLSMAMACRHINRILRADFIFKLDPAGWVNVYDGRVLIGTIE